MSTIYNDDENGGICPPRRFVVLRGRFGGRKGKNALQVKPAPPRPITDGVLMCELAPKLMDDTERGAGDSTNARLHRLLHKR